MLGYGRKSACGVGVLFACRKYMTGMRKKNSWCGAGLLLLYGRDIADVWEKFLLLKGRDRLKERYSWCVERLLLLLGRLIAKLGLRM